MAEYEGLGVPLVFIAVAGRSNGLGPVTSGNVNVPTINCPPVTPDWGAEDIWSSMRVPSGLGCTTVLFPEAAALAAAQILGLRDHVVWSTLRCEQMNTWIGLKHADKEIRKDQGLNWAVVDRKKKFAKSLHYHWSEKVDKRKQHYIYT